MRRRRFRRTRQRKKCSKLRSSENLVFSGCGIRLHMNGFIDTPYMHFANQISTGSVRNMFWDQQVFADFFNISVGKSGLVLDIILSGSISLTELAEEGKDPFRPLAWDQ